jgi:hypothetical protein
VVDRCLKNTRNIFDVNPAEYLSRLDYSLRSAIEYRHQLIAAGAVDACETENMNGKPGASVEAEPFRLCFKASFAALRVRQKRRLLIDPCTACVAINSCGRQISEPRDMICMSAHILCVRFQDGIPAFVGWY